MLKQMKRVGVILTAMMMIATSISVSAASTRVKDSKVIASMSVGYKSASKKIVFNGKAKNPMAGTAERTGAYGTFYRNGREIDTFSNEYNGNTSEITYSANPTAGTYDFDFHGESEIGGYIYWYTRSKSYTYGSRTSSRDVDNFLIEHADEMLSEMGIDSSGYSATKLNDDSLPYAVVKYCVDLEKGSEHTEPIIYADSEKQNFLIAYQQGDGLNVVEQVNIAGNGRSSNTIRNERYTQQGTRYDMEEDNTEENSPLVKTNNPEQNLSENAVDAQGTQSNPETTIANNESTTSDPSQDITSVPNQNETMINNVNNSTSDEDDAVE